MNFRREKNPEKRGCGKTGRKLKREKSTIKMKERIEKQLKSTKNNLIKVESSSLVGDP